MFMLLCFSCSKEESPYITSKFDPAFANELQARGYIPDASCISAEDVAYITELDVSGTYDAVGELTSLKGIEYFTSLKTLWCSSNQLTSLDVSNNPALVNLDCSSNQLTSLDVSNNPALVDLDCAGNQLTSLDVSNNLALESLYCDYNALISLDVSNNLALESLYCDYNALISLDVSNNLALESLYCDYNALISLDISNNSDLEHLYCSGNPGDGTKFNVAAWFGNDNIPADFKFSYQWIYSRFDDTKLISINFYIPE